MCTVATATTARTCTTSMGSTGTGNIRRKNNDNDDNNDSVFLVNNHSMNNSYSDSAAVNVGTLHVPTDACCTHETYEYPCNYSHNITTTTMTSTTGTNSSNSTYRHHHNACTTSSTSNMLFPLSNYKYKHKQKYIYKHNLKHHYKQLMFLLHYLFIIITLLTSFKCQVAHSFSFRSNHVNHIINFYQKKQHYQKNTLFSFASIQTKSSTTSTLSSQLYMTRDTDTEPNHNNVRTNKNHNVHYHVNHNGSTHHNVDNISMSSMSKNMSTNTNNENVNGISAINGIRDINITSVNAINGASVNSVHGTLKSISTPTSMSSTSTSTTSSMSMSTKPTPIFTPPSSTTFSSSSPNSTSSSSSSLSSSSSFSSLASSIAMLTENDQKQLSHYWSNKLLPNLSYLNPTNHSIIYQALQVAYIYHKHQFRKSGEPFIIHPIEVTILLSELQMDVDTLIAGLLHDTVEDTDLTFGQIESYFGITVRNIVEGETKVSKLPSKLYSTQQQQNNNNNNNNNSSNTISSRREDEQAENLRQMFIAMTNDYRIIIVKLADRLHNMRTLQHMKPAKQQKISKETLDIFAPLAHRMGIWNFKSELEDLSFYYLYPNEYKHLKEKLEYYSQKWNDTLETSKQRLKEVLQEDTVLKDQCIDITVNGRTKELYSLYCKMKKKGEENLDHITDVVALRVILEPRSRKHKKSKMTVSLSSSSPSSSLSSSGVNFDGKVKGERDNLKENENEKNYEYEEDDEEEDTRNEPDCGVWLCYHVLGLVQHLPGFQPVPTKVKDYISFPKPNGYQSLHTALILNGQTIEVQIRTAAMHRIAEFGMAAHWAYKEGNRRHFDPNSNNNNGSSEKLNDIYNTPWLSTIKEWQDEVVCSRDFVDCVRRELLGKRVFVFLRNGKILNLSKGSTAIDAAFQIHTEVGLTMIGAEINGKPVPLSYELQNGDVVSILTGSDGQPDIEWMKYAKIRSTRSKLRSYFRRNQRQNLRDVGFIILMEYLRTFSDVIEESSFLEASFKIPTTAEALKKFLPGNSNYHDLDDLLIEIGTTSDSNVLRTAIAKIFLVPQKTLASAEDNTKQTLSRQLLDTVNAKRQSALDISTALEKDESNFDDIDATGTVIDDTNGSYGGNVVVNGSRSSNLSTLSSPSSSSGLTATTDFQRISINGDNLIVNGGSIADPEHLCPSCLPIFGDEIIGTRPHGMGNNDFVTTVHRSSCEIALKAKNEARSGSTSQVKPSWTKRLKNKLGGLKLKQQRSLVEDGENNAFKSLEPVDLIWDESYAMGEKFLYLAEISLICEDRKLLLADCSEIVSDMSEIVKTGSLSTKEHAILNFLVKVESLNHLQQLMNRLREIRSVMSVERNFGSSL